MIVTKAAIHIFNGNQQEMHRYSGLNPGAVCISHEEFMYTICDGIDGDAKQISRSINSPEHDYLNTEDPD